MVRFRNNRQDLKKRKLSGSEQYFNAKFNDLIRYWIWLRGHILDTIQLKIYVCYLTRPFDRITKARSV